MGALNSSSMLLQKGNVWVGDSAGSVVDLGALRKVKFTGKLIKQPIESDNRGTILNHARLNGMIEAEWLEPGSVSNLAIMFKGLVTATTIAGSSTPVTGEVTAAGSWTYGSVIYFAQQSGTGAKPTSVTVTGGTDGALTVATDYDFVQEPGSGRWGIVITDSTTVTTQNQTVTLAYTTTPNASRVLTGGASLTQTARYVKIVGPLESDSNVTRTIILTSATAASDMLLPFVDVENGNDVGVMPFTFENDKAATWTITDQVNPN